ncbi:hypothetical protein INT47_000322 [Mucor saturninus]|uniref:Uncharacterized protein n=1 Tax=Mucor saturninus TaxID=64648 RepID=A0A8H7UUD7_9FUNG|nr:hypothetical protein INT47_000322 [Mucor saturninus]
MRKDSQGCTSNPKRNIHAWLYLTKQDISYAAAMVNVCGLKFYAHIYRWRVLLNTKSSTLDSYIKAKIKNVMISIVIKQQVYYKQIFKIRVGYICEMILNYRGGYRVTLVIGQLSVAYVSARNWSYLCDNRGFWTN